MILSRGHVSTGDIGGQPVCSPLHGLGVLVLQIASWQQWQVLDFGQSILGRKGVVGVLDPGNDDTLGDVFVKLR